MRLAITIARLPGQEKFTVLTGPEVPLNLHLAEFKQLILAGGEGFAEVQIWESSSGVVKQKKFAVVPLARPVIVVPTLEEVIASGHTEAEALVIIARQQALFDALAANPNLTNEELLRLEEVLPHSTTRSGEAGPESPAEVPPLTLPATPAEGTAVAVDLASLTVAELRELAVLENIDLAGCTLKAEIIAAITLAQDDAGPSLAPLDEGVFPS